MTGQVPWNQIILGVIGFAYLLLQFIYQVWNKNQTAKILDCIRNSNDSLAQKIDSGIDSFGPHLG